MVVCFVADSVSIPEGEVTATGVRAAIPRSSIHSGAADSLSVSENSSVSLVLDNYFNPKCKRNYKPIDALNIFSLCRERRGLHSTSATDRVRDSSGGVLALRQLLVAGAGGHPGGRLTRGGGRVHARVAPAVRGAGPRQRRLAVTGAAAAGAASSARASFSARRSPPLPRNLPPATVRHTSSAANFLTGASTPLLSAA